MQVKRKTVKASYKLSAKATIVTAAKAMLKPNPKKVTQASIINNALANNVPQNEIVEQLATHFNNTTKWATARLKFHLNWLKRNKVQA